MEETELNTPPIIFKRNSYGLLNHIEYKYKDDGNVDYFSMLKPEHLFLNKQREKQIEEKYGKKLSELSIQDVETGDLVINLQGIIYLSKIRGFNSIKTKVDHIDGAAASVTVDVEWIPNYETEMRAVTTSKAMGANPNNSSFIGYNKRKEPVYFSEAIASNRAFIANVRFMLQLPVACKEELTSATSVEDDEPQAKTNLPDPIEFLKKIVKEGKWTETDIFEYALQKQWVKEPITDISQFPKHRIEELKKLVKKS